MAMVRNVVLFVAPLLVLGGCVAEIIETPHDVPDPEVPEVAPLELVVETPQYGDFAGGDTIVVSGTVVPVTAELWVEDEAVEIAEDGTFSVELPLDHAYRIIDVLAVSGDEDEDERIPVFSGNPPADTWTGGVTGRLLPDGMERLGPMLGPIIDEAGWAEAVSAGLPSYQSDYLNLTPLGLSHEPTEVELTPAEAGIDLAATLNDVLIEYDLEINVGGTYNVPITIGYGEVTISAVVVPELDEAGVIWLSLADAEIDLADAEIDLGILEGWILEWVLDILNDYVTEPLADALLEWVLGEYGTFELGGPFATEFDLMGTVVTLDLTRLWSDTEGTALTLAMDLGTGVTADPLLMPAPMQGDSPGADAALGVHEALLDSMVSEAVLELLDQDLELEGTFAKLIGTAIVALPGGEGAPNADGWCLSLWPGTAHVVRLQSGTEPLAVLYMPDLQFDVEYKDNGVCEEWLEASLAVEAGIVVEDGTQLGFDIQVPEGKVTDYETDAEWTDEEVIDGLAGLLESIVSLAGGLIEIDLADLLGGLEDTGLPVDLALEITDSSPMEDEDGNPIEGLYAVAVRLFPDE